MATGNGTTSVNDKKSAQAAELPVETKGKGKGKAPAEDNRDTSMAEDDDDDEDEEGEDVRNPPGPGALRSQPHTRKLYDSLS